MSHALKPISVDLIALSTQLKTNSHNMQNSLVMLINMFFKIIKTQ